LALGVAETLAMPASPNVELAGIHAVFLPIAIDR
jgi:hypothetical protein